ncbi:MAG TPA: zinc ribbon domain-containing protein, partial [Gemmatimonadaceae bacterium]
MLRETGSARVAWGPSGSGGTNGDMLRVVIAAAADEYEILGEMGHGSAGAAMVLARELATSQLVALRLDQTTSDDGSVFTVVRELDQTVPALGGTLGGTCPECGTTVANGGRFCTQCGASISLIVAPDEARYDSPAAASEA